MSEDGKQLELVKFMNENVLGIIKNMAFLISNKNELYGNLLLGLGFTGSHNYTTNPQSKIDKQVIRKRNCKRRAEESISCRSVKIIRSE